MFSVYQSASKCIQYISICFNMEELNVCVYVQCPVGLILGLVGIESGLGLKKSKRVGS